MGLPSATPQLGSGGHSEGSSAEGGRGLAAGLVCPFGVAYDGTSALKAATPAGRTPWFLGNAKCMGPPRVQPSGGWLCDDASSHAR